MTRGEDIAARAADVRARIARAETLAGRPAGSVTIVAAGKTRPLEDLLAAHRAGLIHFGENRVQEAEEKLPSLGEGIVKHLIGPLQSNKAKRAARLFDVVHSLDSALLAGRLDRAAAEHGRRLTVFLEIRLGGEPTKSGVELDEVPRLAEEVRALRSLELAGLMTIPPQGETRPHFATLRRLAERLSLASLSMGMSDDYEAAIAEGATHVRIGSALFGEREASATLRA